MKKSWIYFVIAFVFVLTASYVYAADDEEASDAPAPQKIEKESKMSAAGGNFSVGVGPVGNIYVVDARPELGPGVGAEVFFEYRWSPQFATHFGFLFSMQNGQGISKGDNDIILLGIPSFDLKFFMLSNPSRWDPYAQLGLGLYVATEGSQSDGTKAVGVGANVGLGTDFYITEKFSVGVAAVFRSIGMITSTSGSNNGTALFPFSMMGNVAYHF